MEKIMMLSLWQPWASLCIWTNPEDGKAEKQIETRHWSTDYRGLVAIHATKTLVKDAKQEIDTNLEIQAALQRHGFKEFCGVCRGVLPLGKIVGVVELVEIRPLNWINEWLSDFSEREQSFGLYMPGRYGWIFKNPIEFETPISCRGLQSLGTPKPEIREQIFEQLEIANGEK